MGLKTLISLSKSAAPKVKDISNLNLCLRSCNIIHRHSDRTPAVNLFDIPKDGVARVSEEEALASQLETATWMKQLPSEEQLQELAGNFPLKQLGGGAEDVLEKTVLNDVQVVKPYGQLTSYGMKQLVYRGEILSQRYFDELALDVKNVSNLIYVQSTTYARTQQSAQSLLTGFLNTRLHLLDAANKIRVHVPLLKDDFVNAWESRHELPVLVAEMESNDERFTQAEQSMQSTKEFLISKLPYFKYKKFYWIYACDYLITRDAYYNKRIISNICDLQLDIDGHIVDHDSGSSDGHHSEVFHDLLLHKGKILSHTANRFFMWYSNNNLLRFACGDLLSQVHSNMVDVKLNRSDTVLSIYSGHDVTILPVLVGLGAVQLDRYNEVHSSEELFQFIWPPYAAAICFELIESTCDSNYYVRVVYQERVLGMDGADENGLIEFTAFWQKLADKGIIDL